MTKLTRRAALGLGSSLWGVAACGVSGNEGAAEVVTPYDGKVSFDHGVASGDPRSDSVIIWTRVTPVDPDAVEIPVSWYVTDHLSTAEGDNILSGVVYAKKSNDWCVKAEITGLSPDRSYAYFFQIETTDETIQSPSGKTRTTPASGGREIKFGVVSCSNLPFGKFNAYQSLAERGDLDAIIHLGDYLYEYGPDGYGGDIGARIGRPHDPPREIVSLDDYRKRHAQYKSDPQLQLAHAAAPWICTWDDHESTNDSYRTGAENHNSENGEGNWSDRKQVAIQAYMEWMPVREPKPGAVRSAFWRRFDFGDVASIMCLETRLTGRSVGIDWATELGDVATAAIAFKAAEVMSRVSDEERTMLGAEQERWIARELDTSAAQGKTWQVLANQTIMARVRPPNFRRKLSGEQIDAQEMSLIQRLIDFSQLGFPFNLDAWDGFPAARERLYEAAASAGAELVTLTGDTHTAWVNQLHDQSGERRGVEFACTSVTSPGLGTYFIDVPELGNLFVEANKEVEMHRPTGQGYTVISLSKDRAKADFYEVSSITDDVFETELVESYEQAAPPG